MNLQEITKHKEELGITPLIDLKEKGQWIGEFRLIKYDFSSLSEEKRELAENDHATLSPEAMKDKWGAYLISDEVIGKNLLLNGGINSIIWPAVAGGSYTALNNTNARIGVGDSSTAAAATQTGLQASTNKTYQAMDATFPTYGTSQQIVFRATFGSGSANYAWNEFIVDNGTTSLNRLVSTQGTKTAGQSWQISLTITLS